MTCVGSYGENGRCAPCGTKSRTSTGNEVEALILMTIWITASFVSTKLSIITPRQANPELLTSDFPFASMYKSPQGKPVTAELHLPDSFPFQRRESDSRWCLLERPDGSFEGTSPPERTAAHTADEASKWRHRGPLYPRQVNHLHDSLVETRYLQS